MQKAEVFDPMDFDLVNRSNAECGSWRKVTMEPNTSHRIGFRITDEELRLRVSAVLFFQYVANLIYLLITHHDVFSA